MSPSSSLLLSPPLSTGSLRTPPAILETAFSAAIIPFFILIVSKSISRTDNINIKIHEIITDLVFEAKNDSTLSAGWPTKYMPAILLSELYIGI